MAVLEGVARELAREVWVVAPEHDQSGTLHSVSLHAPLRLSRRGERRFGVAGTPGDRVVVAVRHPMTDAPPDLVLSGVNRGANLRVETVFSGTVGAAMTALLLGLPAIALSQAFSQRERHATGCRAGARHRTWWPAPTCAGTTTTGCGSAAAPGRTRGAARLPPSLPSASQSRRCALSGRTARSCRACWTRRPARP